MSDGRPLRLSLITAWELGLLAKSGGQQWRPPPRQSSSPSSGSRCAVATAYSEILIDSSLLPGNIHGDPADRIIVATARTLDLTVVTRDRHILDYAAQGYVRALLC
jgi:PIN domain nuclease of toxin-antitoxin system